jgi:hypothetical protein
MVLQWLTPRQGYRGCPQRCVGPQEQDAQDETRPDPLDKDDHQEREAPGDQNREREAEEQGPETRRSHSLPEERWEALARLLRLAGPMGDETEQTEAEEAGQDATRLEPARRLERDARRLLSELGLLAEQL